MLDAELAAIVSMLPKYDLSDVPACRRVDAEFAAEAARNSPADSGIGTVTWRDQMVPSVLSAPQVLVRVYAPEGLGTHAPGLLFLHGGAFCLGDLDTAHQRCLLFAEAAECLVVNVDYRLAPEHPFPAGLDDCWAVLQWMARGADKFGIDPTRLAVGGSSAGAGLAAALALLSRDCSGPGLVFQLLLFPVTDHRMTTASIASCTNTPVWDSPGCTWMWRHYLGQARDEGRSREVSAYAAPALAEKHGLPPAYILTAEFDPLRDEGIEYGLSLLGAGVHTEIHQVPGAYHAFDVVAPASDVAQRTIAEQIVALKGALHG